MNENKVKIRGIYSTALTKFLLNNGFKIVDPSNKINERFNTENSYDSANILLCDKNDMNGIIINGKGSESLIEVLQGYFIDSVIRKIETGTIYRGTIKKIDKNKNIIFVNIGNNEEGILNLEEYWGFLRENEKVIVQLKGIINGKKILSSKLRIFGDSLILIKEGFNKVSKNIYDEEERKRLMNIANKIKIEGWSILWKSHAQGKPDLELVTEVNQLIQKEKDIRNKLNNIKEDGIIERGSLVYIVDFGGISKQKLDNLRKSVANTVIGHHFLKAGGYSMLTDFAESLNIDDNILTDKINKVLKEEGPKEGSYYEIIHKKANGRDIIMKGTVIKAEENEVLIRRNLRYGKFLDGLQINIDEGDYAITSIKPGSWTLTHKYFNKEGFQKGSYININTPIEVYPKFARYIDLEVDVIERNNKREIIDLEKLEEIKKIKAISQELYDKALEIANKIVQESN